jgi:hypothetical protein
MRLTERITRLEKKVNDEPMLTMQVETSPTREQTATIDHCTKTGRRLLVFYTPGDSAWMLGCGAPPWEVEHGNA